MGNLISPVRGNLFSSVRGNLFSSVRGNFSKLPLDEIRSILSRLPLETLKECRLVCKEWRNTISEPTFGKVNLPHLIKLQSQIARELSILEKSKNDTTCILKSQSIPKRMQIPTTNSRQAHVNGGSIETLVYTLGSGLGWTSNGTYALEDPPWGFEQVPPVFARGALHWRNTVDGGIIIFDLTKETLIFGLELPDFPEGVPLNDHSIGGGNVTLNWTVKLRLWESKLFAITQSGNALCISRWAVLMYDRSALACLMDGTTGSTVCTELATVFGLRSVIPHMNSLLTLEDIGEKNARPMLSLDDKLQARSELC
ncbi:hypothetical protein C5167_016165 [Papaver somniferum]|nr:hypothetical protein C5167_016165 [Papaver somniferum]